MADVDAALVQQVFDISKRKWKSDIHHHRQADDFWTGLEVSKWGVFCHPFTLGCANERGKKVPLTLPNWLPSTGIVESAY